MEPEKSFPRPSLRCDRTAFLITNGGDAAAKNAQAPAEDLNVEGLSGGARREEKEILNQWECGELSRNFIRLQVCGSASHPKKRRQTSAELTSASMPGGKRGLSVGPSGGAPERGQGLRPGGGSRVQKHIGFRWLNLPEVCLGSAGASSE